MKTLFPLLLAAVLPATARAQANALPPDFELFGLTCPDYVPNWFQYAYNLSPSADFFLPSSGPLDEAPIYYLQRISVSAPPPATSHLQNYYLPDNVYVFFPVITFEADNIAVPESPAPVEQLKDDVRGFLEPYVEVRAFIDGVEVPDMSARRLREPVVFGVNISNTNNILGYLYGFPVFGLLYPLVADGYFLMLEPLSPGPHHIRTVLIRRLPDGTIVTGGRQYILNSLRPTAFLGYQVGQLETALNTPDLPTHRRQPLLASIAAARASFEADNTIAGINQLEALQNKLRAQLGSSHPTPAQSLTESITRILQQAQSRSR